MSIFDSDVFQSRHIGPDAADTAADAEGGRRAVARRADRPGDSVPHPADRAARPAATARRSTRSFATFAALPPRTSCSARTSASATTDCVTPSVILRNVLENPGWYTPYTPYQAEIAQGRLEALLNYQTMVADLTGMEIVDGVAARRSDGGRRGDDAAAPRAVASAWRASTRPPQFFVADSCYPQTIDVLKARAEPLGIELVIGSMETAVFGDRDVRRAGPVAGRSGRRARSARVHRARESQPVCWSRSRSDLLSLTLLTPPGEMGADVVLRQLAAFRRADGIRRSARGVLRHQGEACPAGARPHHRRLGGRARPHGLPHVAADTRAAHPPREGDVEHLHRAGAAGQHRRTLRGVARPEGPDGDWRARARAGHAARRAAHRARTAGN